MDGYLLTALSAARAALNIASRPWNPMEAREPGL